MEIFAAQIKRFIPKNAFIRSVALLTGVNVLSQVIVVASSPLLTRLYTPEEMGILSAFTSITMVLLSIVAWLYETAIPLPREEKKAINILAVAVSIVLIMCTLTAIGVAFFGGQMALVVNSPSVEPYLWLLPVGLLGAGLYQVLSYWAVRKKEFPSLANTRWHESLSIVVSQLGLGLLKLGSFGLLMGIVVGRLVSNGGLIKLILTQSKDALKRISMKGMWDVVKRYRRFPLISSWSALLNAVAFQLPYLLLTMFYGPQVLGWVALAQRVLGLPFNLLGTSVGQVYLAEAARIKDDHRQLMHLFMKTVKHLTFVGVPALGLIVLAAPWAFSVVFGPNWTEAGKYLQAMAVMFFMQLVATPIRGNLYVLERQDLHLYCEIIRLTLMSGSLLLATYLNKSAIVAVIYLGIGGSIGNFMPIVFSWWAVRRSCRNKRSESDDC